MSDDPAAAGAAAPARRGFRLAKVALVAAGLACIGVLVVQGRGEIAVIARDLRWGPFGASLALALVTHAVAGQVLGRLLAKHGEPVPARLASAMFFYSQVAKYVPGKVWGLVYQAATLRASLPGFRVVFFANVDQMAMAMAANVAVAVALVLAGMPGWSLLAALVGLVVVVGVYRSALVAIASAPLRRLLRMPAGAGATRVDGAGTAWTALYYLAMWVAYVPACFLLLDAALGLGPARAAPVIAFMCLAWVTGALAFVVPAGIGVREVVFVWLFQHSGVPGSLELIGAVAVLFRFWQVLQDALGALVQWTWDRCARDGRDRQPA